MIANITHAKAVKREKPAFPNRFDWQCPECNNWNRYFERECPYCEWEEMYNPNKEVNR